MKKIVAILGVLLLAWPAWAQPREPVAPEQKLRQAEQLIANVMRGLGTRLDGGTAFRRAFAGNKDVLLYALKESEQDMRVSPQVLQKLDAKILRQGISALLSSYLLGWLYYSYQEENDRFVHADSEHILREVKARLNKRQRTLFRRFDKGDEEATLKTRIDVFDCIFIFKLMTEISHRRFPRSLRHNLQNQVTVEASPREPDEDERKMVAKPLYNVTADIHGVWGHFHFTVVEEAGAMKIASLWIGDGPQ